MAQTTFETFDVSACLVAILTFLSLCFETHDGLRERMTQAMFESFNVSALLVTIQAVLSLSALRDALSHTVFINEVTHCLCHPSFITRFLTEEHLTKFLTERGYSI